MDRIIFGTGYEELRKKYIRRFSSYTLPYSKLSYHGIKLLLTSDKMIRANEYEGNYRLFYDKEDLMKSLLADVLKYRLKSLVHYKDYVSIDKNEDISANWNIVSNYYSAFSYACFLMRLLHRGTLFFDSDTKQCIERNISNELGERISVDSNCTFRIDYDNDFIELKKSDGKVHEVVWRETNRIIDEMMQFSRPKDDERAFLSHISKINNQQGATFPSKLRNLVNYQPEYIIRFLRGEFHKTNILKDPIQQIFKYSYDESETIDQKITIYTSYQQYLMMLADRFFRDYLNMAEKPHLLKAYPLLKTPIE